jgi:hypothetical protein
MADYLNTQEWRSYSVRPYPKPEHSLAFGDLAVLAVGVCVGTLTGWYITAFFAAIGGMFLLHAFAYPLRCPQCRGPVMTRQVDDEPGYRQFFHDCPECRITWECEKFRLSD